MHALPDASPQLFVEESVDRFHPVAADDNHTGDPNP